MQEITFTGKAEEKLDDEIRKKIDETLEAKMTNLFFIRYIRFQEKKEKNEEDNPAKQLTKEFFEDEQMRTPEAIEFYIKQIILKFDQKIIDKIFSVSNIGDLKAIQRQRGTMFRQVLLENRLLFLNEITEIFVDKYQINIENAESITRKGEESLKFIKEMAEIHIQKKKEESIDEEEDRQSRLTYF